MTRDKSKFDVLGKIEKERTQRNWTEYTLAKNAGITQSTISTWYRRQLQPSVASIEKICVGLGITMSEFFQEDDHDAFHGMTKDQFELYKEWSRLNKDQKKALLELLKTMNS
jgi:transcriptional regulator with XRE-family HTH domain